MKRVLAISVTAALAMLVGGLIWVELTPPVFNPTEGSKLFEAARAYSKDLRAHGKLEPAEVTLKELLAKGYMKADEVKSLAGLDVTIYPEVDESHPLDIQIRVRMSDGSEVALMADGSVQSLARRRCQ